MKTSIKIIIWSFILVANATITAADALADNDDLAFDFIHSPVNSSVKKCYVFGDINTHEFENTKFLLSSDFSGGNTFCESVRIEATKIIKSYRNKSNDINQCYVKGYYTKDILRKIKLNSELKYYEAVNYDNIGNYCQEVHEELYPRAYKLNRKIRGLVK